MNTRIRSLTAITLTFVSAFTWAQDNAESETVLNGSVAVIEGKPVAAEVSGADIVKNLRQDELQVTNTGAILPSYNSRTNRVLRKLSRGLPPSREGIPGFDEEPSADDVIRAGYPTNIMIRRAMEKAEAMGMKSRITAYETSIKEIIDNSGQKANEEAVRIVLNRSDDVVQNIIRWAGRNSDYISQFLAEFYNQSFNIALSYSNNPPSYVDSNFPRAKVGVYFARALYAHQTALISDSAKAIMLIKTLGYLGQDINSDIQMRREGVYRYALMDIVNLQKNDEQYQNILRSLEAKQEPKSSDVAGVRSEIARILSSLPN